MLEGIGPSLDLASAAGMDLAQTADIMTDGMSMFGMQAEEAGRMSDVLAAASSSTNTNVDQLGEALKYAGANAAAAGMDIEQTSAFLGLLADNGIKGSMAGTTLNAMLRDLKANAEDGSLAVGDQSVALYDANGEMRDMTDVMDDLISATAHMSDEQRDQAVSSILGQEALKGFNVYASEGAGAVGALEDELRNSKGAASDMAETMQDNLNGALTNLKSALEEVGIAIGTALIPVVEKAVELAKMLADKFNGLDDKTQTIIAVVSALAAGFLLLVGPILLLVGFIPSIIAGFTALSTVIAAITGPIGLIVAAIASAIAIGVAWYKNFEKLEDKIGTTATLLLGMLNPITGLTSAIKIFKRGQEDAIEPVERFGESVSESTQEAVGAFMDMSEEADIALKEIAWSQEEMTRDMAESMIEGQQEITDTLLGAIDERHQEEIEATREQFENLDGLSEERKQQIIEQTNERFEEERVATEEGNRTINEIIQAAADEKRALTQEESDEILAIREDMTNQAVEVMSENQEEQKLIYEKMKDNATDLSAREAAEVVQNATKKKDDVIDEANEQFTETRLWAERQRDELGTLSEEEAQEIIESAEEKLDETISAAEETHENVVKEAQDQADEHVDLVDWETGEIKSKWQVMKDNVVKKTEEMAKSVGTWFVKMYVKAKNKAEDTKEAVKEKYEEIKESIKEKLTDAVRIVGEKIGEMPGKVLEFVDDMKEAGKDLVLGLIGGIKSLTEDAIEAISGVVGGVIKKAKSLLDTNSPSRVFIAIGSDTVKGYEEGIDGRKKHAEREITDLFDKVLKATKKKHNEELKSSKRNNDEAIDLDKKAREKLLSVAENYVEERRRTGEMSLSDEVYFWNTVYRTAEKGSEQYELGMRKHQEAVQKMRTEVESLNKEYKDRIIKINEEYNTESKRLLDEHEQAYDNHLDKMLGFAGVFDTFEREMDKTGHDFIEGMQSQVDALIDYEDVMNSLGERINNDSLIDELKGMGVQAVGELQALNELSDEELEKYVELYQEKFQRAKLYTDDEMTPMMEEVDQKLIGLKKDTSKRLDQVNEEWQMKIKQIVNGVDDEFDSMHQVGIDAMQGLSDGIGSMEGHLLRQATSIAESIKATIASAFDIHSPSRWMHDMIGQNMMMGWIGGMESKRAALIRIVEEMSNSVKDSFDPNLGKIGYSTLDSRKMRNGIQPSTDSDSVSSGGITQHLTINSPRHLSPSETARKNKQASRQLAMEWGM